MSAFLVAQNLVLPSSNGFDARITASIRWHALGDFVRNFFQVSLQAAVSRPSGRAHGLMSLVACSMSMIADQLLGVFACRFFHFLTCVQ